MLLRVALGGKAGVAQACKFGYQLSRKQGRADSEAYAGTYFQVVPFTLTGEKATSRRLWG